MASRIFINYRRSLNLANARLLRAHLQKHFGQSRVFLDVRNLDGGDHWMHKLEDEIDRSSAVVALIGEGWVNEADENGERLLDDPNDFVRFEIARALNRGIPVLPVQIDNAPMPAAAELPPHIQALTYTQAMLLRGESFEDDAGKIAERLKQLIASHNPSRFAPLQAGIVSFASCVGTAAVIYGLVNAGAISIGASSSVYTKRIQELESKIADQTKQIASLHKQVLKVEGLTARVDALKEQKSELEDKVQDQSSHLVEKKLEIEALNARVSKLVTRYDIGGTFRDCKVCPEMVVLPAGSFTMGSEDGENDEKPTHEVMIASRFAVGKFEVSFTEWDACVADNACRHNPSDSKWGRGNRPVINVSWRDSNEYIAWLNTKVDGAPYRLLSEAEWEYAARAGTTARFYNWGDEIGEDKANCKGCGSRWDGKQTAPVGSFDPNAYGLHDLHGNVWEWLQDCWNDDYRRAPDDGSAWVRLGECNLRIVRGGAWGFSSDSLRFSNRRRYTLTNRLASIGFRVARTLDIDTNAKKTGNR